MTPCGGVWGWGRGDTQGCPHWEGSAGMLRAGSPRLFSAWGHFPPSSSLPHVPWHWEQPWPAWSFVLLNSGKNPCKTQKSQCVPVGAESWNISSIPVLWSRHLHQWPRSQQGSATGRLILGELGHILLIESWRMTRGTAQHAQICVPGLGTLGVPQQWQGGSSALGAGKCHIPGDFRGCSTSC